MNLINQNCQSISPHLVRLLPKTDLFNLLTVSGPSERRQEPLPLWNTLFKILRRLRPEYLFQYLAFNVTTIGLEPYERLSKDIFTLHPSKINLIVNSKIKEMTCIELAMKTVKERTIVRLLTAGALCPFIVDENHSVIDALRNNEISPSSSRSINTSRYCEVISPTFRNIQQLVASHLECFLNNRWDNLNTFIDSGYIHMTLPTTSLTALSIAIQQDNAPACIQLLENGARLGNRNHLDSPAAALFGYNNSEKRQNTRNTILLSVSNFLRTSDHIYQYFMFYVEKNDCNKVREISRSEDFNFARLPVALGSPLSTAIKGYSLEMVRTLCSLEIDLCQGDQERTFVEVVIEKIRGEHNLVKMNPPGANLNNIKTLHSILQTLLAHHAPTSPHIRELSENKGKRKKKLQANALR